MIRVFLILLSIFFVTSCKSKQNPKYIGKDDGTFYLDHLTFNENKDSLLSHTKYVLGSINDKVNVFNIDKPETLALKIGSTGVRFDYLQFWVNKETNKFIFLESEAESNEAKNQEIINNLKQSFKMIDLTDKERLSEDIKDRKTYLYHKSYLFKSAKVYVYMETITFKDKKEKNKVRLNFYSYPFASLLIELNQINTQIIDQ
jgi:hypothetical protein